MLHQYSFANYLSFMDETTVSLETNQVDNYVGEDFDGKKLSLATCIIGANASGKTSLLKPIALLEWLISKSFQENPDAKIPIEKHFFSESPDSKFSYIFSYKNEMYKYHFTIRDGIFLNEQLAKKGKLRFEYVLKREWIDVAETYVVKAKERSLESNKTLRSRTNASLISILTQLGFDTFKDLKDVFQTNKLHLKIDADFTYRLNNIPMIQQMSIANNINGNSDLIESVKNVIMQLDLGISDMGIKEVDVTDQNGKDSKLKIFTANHRLGLKEVERNFVEESSGTQALLAMFVKVFPVLKNGGIFAVDEIESDLHPIMVKHLLSLFSDSEINVKNAQLIFTTHSLEVINLLEKSQIYLVEKNQCISEAWRLDEIDGVRRDDNYYAKYMSGAYGAIPRI